ncbi:unnamed protein product [Paramecium sonneborni]|uniref:Cyclic nucleotide-binding domain-containing protein n=1 Tax=Paramecium sonneborni TaxID=65129 RepID=A0A8S1KI50_9CILI|nr:unnamed protein product [Paramecium sonneborni]
MEEQDSRQYLASKVHPLFEKLLIELLITKPEDPVEFMSQWLHTTGQQYRPQEKLNGPLSSTIPAQFQNSMQSGTPRRSQVQSLQNPLLNRQQSNQPGSNHHIPHHQSNQQLSHQHSNQPINSQHEINSQQLQHQNQSKQALEQSDFQEQSFEASQNEAEHQFDVDPKFGFADQPSPSPIVKDTKNQAYPFQKQQSILTQKFQPQSNNNKSFKKTSTQSNPVLLQPVTIKTAQPQIIVNNTPKEQIQSSYNSNQQNQQKLIQSKDEQEIQENQALKRNSQTDSNNKFKEQKSRILKKINNCHIFKHLNDQQKEVVANTMEERRFKCNDIVIKQGEEGDQLFLVEDGLLDCIKKDKQNHEEKLITYQIGDFFGEMALLYNEKRATTIIAKEDSVLWILDKQTFNSFIKQPVFEKRQKYDQILQQFQVLQQIDPYIRLLIADALHVVTFKAKEIVFRQNDQGDYFYLIQEGQLKAFKQGEKDEIEQQVYVFDKFDYFGELAMLKEIKRQATLVCETDCILLGLDKQSFKKLLAPIHDLLKQKIDRYRNLSFN